MDIFRISNKNKGLYALENRGPTVFSKNVLFHLVWGNWKHRWPRLSRWSSQEEVWAPSVLAETPAAAWLQKGWRLKGRWSSFMDCGTAAILGAHCVCRSHLVWAGREKGAFIQWRFAVYMPRNSWVTVTAVTPSLRKEIPIRKHNPCNCRADCLVGGRLLCIMHLFI